MPFWNTDQIARLTARGMKTLVSLDSAVGSRPPRTAYANALRGDARAVS